MFSIIKSAAVGAALSIAALASPALAATEYTVGIAGTAVPWDVALNPGFAFSDPGRIAEATGPTVFDLAGNGFTSSVYILFQSGLTYSFGEGFGAVDLDGYVGSVFKDGDPGSTGGGFPSFYMPSEWSTDPGLGIFLNGLVGAFTDDAGVIVGDPFPVGYVIDVDPDPINVSPGYVVGIGRGIPLGATKLSLGINDDIFIDNGGSLSVCIRSDDFCGTTAPVPEPTSWALMIAGFGIAGAALRLRSRAKLAFA